eukprot:SAG11_NODE_1922_length_4061_cov_13.009339_3_plen_237_part_00
MSSYNPQLKVGQAPRDPRDYTYFKKPRRPLRRRAASSLCGCCSAGWSPPAAAAWAPSHSPRPQRCVRSQRSLSLRHCVAQLAPKAVVATGGNLHQQGAARGARFEVFFSAGQSVDCAAGFGRAERCVSAARGMPSDSSLMMAWAKLQREGTRGVRATTGVAAVFRLGVVVRFKLREIGHATRANDSAGPNAHTSHFRYSPSENLELVRSLVETVPPVRAIWYQVGLYPSAAAFAVA